MTWQFADLWSATAVAAAAYRPPDLMDLFKYIDLGSGVALYGNPELDPERSAFFETGLHYVSKRFNGTVSVYANDLSDLITEVQKSPAEIRMENVDRALIYGSDLSLQWRITDAWTAQADLAWTRGENKTSHEPLPFIAPLNGRLAFRYGSDGRRGWWVETALDWAAAQDRTPPGQNPSESWQTIGLTAGYRFKALGLDHTWIIGVTNVLDENYSNYLSTSRGLELKEAGTGVSCSWKFNLGGP
nr:TonB-dependent receptor [Desulfobacula sp.]